MARAANDSTTLRSAQIAPTCNASQYHLLQVVKALGAQDFIATLRGRKGWLHLTQPVAQIAMGALVGMSEANVHSAEWLVPSTDTGPLMAICCLRGVVVRALDAFFATQRTF